MQPPPLCRASVLVVGDTVSHGEAAHGRHWLVLLCSSGLLGPGVALERRILDARDERLHFLLSLARLLPADGAGEKRGPRTCGERKKKRVRRKTQQHRQPILLPKDARCPRRETAAPPALDLPFGLAGLLLAFAGNSLGLGQALLLCALGLKLRLFNVSQARLRLGRHPLASVLQLLAPLLVLHELLAMDALLLLFKLGALQPLNLFVLATLLCGDALLLLALEPGTDGRETGPKGNPER